ncbi:hypothetical protein QFC21_004492 [Naganishia friedmannii]|uniref:Uncharacterized protein n=1 Tax=Naganishia friedmannii TaxID=89922 RepID=A0ACC2VGJ6_9TREE|nr:hypothetical protein QFC21_004492 [Naganishia friedmannii]
MTREINKRIVRVALLINDTPVPSVAEAHGDYLQVYTTHLKDSLASFPDEVLRNSIGDLVVDGYNVMLGEYPPEERLLSSENGGEANSNSDRWVYDCVMMTGSASSSYQPIPWILKLVDFIRDLVTDEKKRAIKIIGICFGMQILALALGSNVEPNPAGWELGVYDVQLTDCGKEWLGRVVTEKNSKTEVLEEGKPVKMADGEALVRKEQDLLSIQQVHRDYVTSLPKDTHLVGSTPKCQVQGFIRYYPTSNQDTAHRPIRILALQGHPEFIPDIVNKIIDVRSSSGVLDAATTEEARRRAGRKMVGGRGVLGRYASTEQDSEGVKGLEGRGVVGWAVLKVLLE